MILDENLLHSPFGSTDPYQFYRLLNVEINASLPQIELHTRSFRSCIIPTGTTPTKTPGQLNFRSSRPSKARSQTLRNDKNTTVNPGGPLRMPSASVDVPQRLHRMGSGTTCRNAKQRLHLRQRGRAAEPLMSLIRQMQTLLHHTEPVATRRRRL